ncbi:MAG: ABC transporter permease, partial [Acidobacteriota bacterium]|nr:ABC transporter permease [Acidobacteriota bacterium]
LQATRVDLVTGLKEGGRSVGGGGGGGRRRGWRGRLHLGRALVVAQIGLSLLLLVGAGLFVRSLQNLAAVETGFARDHLLMVSMNSRVLPYDKPHLLRLYERLVTRVEAIPGVRSASLSIYGLLSGSVRTSNVVVPGRDPRAQGEDVQRLLVTPRYLETVGMHLLAGRDFTPSDREGASKVAIVNESMARRYFPGKTEGALGRRFGFGDVANSHDLEIVGVVRDARYNDLRETPPPMTYLPVAQDVDTLRDLEVRTVSADTGPVAAVLRRAIAEVEPNLPVTRIVTIGEQIDRSLAQERAIARLTGFFGLLSLLLAAIGLYGVVSYNVARRTNEIGLRMALGARRGTVLGLILREITQLLLLGVVAGLAASLVAIRLASHQLFGLSAYDPATLLMAAFLMTLVALFAGFLPARRAAGTDPMAALRYE